MPHVTRQMPKMLSSLTYIQMTHTHGAFLYASEKAEESRRSKFSQMQINKLRRLP